MNSIEVKTSSSHYTIWVGSGLLGRIGALAQGWTAQRKICIVTQKAIAQRYLSPLRKGLKSSGPVTVHLVPDGETAKSEKELFRLYHTLLRQKFERRDLLIALGGGVVGDLTGFAAATYLRGVPFIQAGTTLLAQIDSSIGGKTGINLGEGKNLVGAFYPPKAVVSDVETLRTLPDRELAASLAEAVKYGMIRSPQLFEFLETCSQEILNKNLIPLEQIVLESSKIKADVVTKDEFETKGERMILNFGHTFGHGVEQATAYKKFLHGEAVAAGMACASRLAVMLGYFREKSHQRMIRLLERFHLPVSLKGSRLSAAKIMTAMSRDKKVAQGKMRFVLPVEIGKVTVREDVPASFVLRTLRELGAS